MQYAISILLGILGALLGVYYKESFDIAMKKKNIASRIKLKILLFNKMMLEGSFKPLFESGLAIHVMSRSLINKGKMDEVNNELQRIKNALKVEREKAKSNDDAIKTIELMFLKYEKSKDYVSEIQEDIKREIANINDGIDYWSSNEVVELPSFMAYQAMIFKNCYFSIMNYFYDGLTYIKHGVIISNDEKIDSFYNLMEAIIEGSTISIVLSKNCDSIIRKNLLILALKTMFVG